MYKESVMKPDLGNGYYINPILNGDYADPAVFREGENYYLCVSTGNYLPGLTIFHSKDLVNWAILHNPLKDFYLSSWAPDFLKYKDKYYIYFSAEGSNYVIWSDKVDQGWSDPIDLKVDHIDPGHITDENGKRYLFLSQNYVVPLSDDGLSITGAMTQVLEAPVIPESWEVEGDFPEAPNIFKENGYYYLTYANGGTSGPATSHMIVSARAKNIYGPWEMSPYNPIVHTWNRYEKWISKGHGHFIKDTEGKWWVIYHAYENGYESLGRKLLLSPVEFTEDGWFRITADAAEAYKKPSGQNIGIKDQLSDTFSEKQLKNTWRSWGENNWKRYSLDNGHLSITGAGTEIGQSHPLTVIAGDHSYEISIKLKTEGKNLKTGLILQYDEKIYNAISYESDKLVIYRLGTPLWKEDISKTEWLWLKMKNKNQYLSFYYSLDGKKYKKLSPVINVIHQNTNAYNEFLSLRPGIFSCGEGRVIFRDFYYTGLN